MSLFKNKKRNRWLARLIVVSFSIMAAFSIFLHDHEFDLNSIDEDCAPCQWTQINVDIQSDIPVTDFIPVRFTTKTETTPFHHKNLKYSYFGLSPPVFS